MNQKSWAAVLLLLTLVFTALTGCQSNTVEDPAATGTQPSAGDTAQSEPTTEVQPTETRLSFLGAGDNIMHDAIIADARNRAADGEKYNFLPMYTGIADLIADADISFINQEGPVAGASYGAVGYPDFNAPDEVFATLQTLGFDVVNLANNHMLDQGPSGMTATIQNAANYSFLSIGGYSTTDYDTPRVLEKDGVRIAFLSYTTLINYDHMDEISALSGYVIPYAEDAVITRQVNAAKQAADFVIVSMHWGDEDAFAPNAKQERLAQLMADLGVDVIVGHHPHVVEPVKWLTGADGGRTLCVYSLGNLICTMHYSQNMAGGLITFDLVKKADGTTAVENPLLIPTVCHYSLTRDSLQVYRMEDYSEALAAQHGSTLKNTFNYALLESYITNTISADFLPEFLR